MIGREHDLPITKQAEVLKISRGPVIIDRVRTCPPTSRSCNRSTGCICNLLSLVRECCETCWLPRGARSAAGMSKR